MVDMLPDEEQAFAFDLANRLVLARDPDFTKVTPEEAARINAAESSGFLSEDDIDWDDLTKYA